MADAHGKARIADVMQQLPFHLGDEVAGGAMTAAGVKADRPLAQALIRRAEQVIGLHLPAAGKVMRLLPRQPQVLAGKGALGVGHGPA